MKKKGSPSKGGGLINVLRTESEIKSAGSPSDHGSIGSTG